MSKTKPNVKKKKWRQYEADFPEAGDPHSENIPPRLPLPEGKRLIRVFVEGYEDVAFWRGVFDDYESDEFAFEISVPMREDLAKGKKVVLRMAAGADSTDTLFCIDSDFDYLFSDKTPEARIINSARNIFHTYTYSVENYLCYAPSLHNICVRATKNDMRIFDFEKFLAEYSRRIFPLFVWYAWSAQNDKPNIFPLLDFKAAVKINYLDFPDNGRETLEWVGKHAERKLEGLKKNHPEIARQIPAFERKLLNRGVTEENCYLFMHGHTLMDNVLMPVLDGVCDRLKYLSTLRINNSARRGLSLVNEQSNYKNSQEDIRTGLLFNENYKDCFLYRKLREDINRYLSGI
jgi:hypothetical protein